MRGSEEPGAAIVPCAHGEVLIGSDGSDGGLREFDADGAVVGAGDFGLDEGGFQAGPEFGADQEVVETPPDVPGAGAGHEAPPSVMAAAWFEFPEGVEEAGVEYGLESGAFLGGEAVVAEVGFRVREVQFGVGDVEIAAEDYGLGGLESAKEGQERPVPVLSIVEAGQFPLGVGDVDVDEEEVGELGGEHSSFAVMRGNADAGGYVEGAMSGEDGGAAVTLLLGGVPVGGIGGGPALLDVVGAGFGFLEAEDVGAVVLEVVQEVLAQHRAETVDIPGDKLHRGEGTRRRGSSNLRTWDLGRSGLAVDWVG